MAARIRQLLALALLVHYGVEYFNHPREHGICPGIDWYLGYLVSDPATPVFILLSMVGVGLRLFWGRYLAICFSAVLLLVHAPRLFWFFQDELAASEWLIPLGRVAVILLLSGSSMAAFFEQRPSSRHNRWAGADPRVVRLRYLVLAQALFLGFFYAARPMVDEMMVAILFVGGMGLLGLTFLKTWSLLALAGAMVLEAWVVLDLSLRAIDPQAYFRDITTILAAVLGLLLLVSAVLAAPFFKRMLRQLRG